MKKKLKKLGLILCLVLILPLLLLMTPFLFIIWLLNDILFIILSSLMEP